MERYKPIVTVQVIAYNSSETIISTLDSIKSQTYLEIELVVSDDNSSDNTLDLTRKWIKTNGERFIRTEIVTTKENTGVAGNCNRAIDVSSGVFIKTIAADDILLPNCIQDNLDFMNDHPDALIVFSQICKFKEVDGIMKTYGVLPTEKDAAILNSTNKLQLLHLYSRNYLPIPSCFVRATIFEKYRYSENYMFEDWPFMIKILQNGIHLHFFERETVMYRLGNSQSYRETELVNIKFQIEKRKFFYNEICRDLYNNYPKIFRQRMILFFIEDIEILLLRNKKNIFSRIIIRILTLLFKKDISNSVPDQYAF